jgi:hypothetical protein
MRVGDAPVQDGKLYVEPQPHHAQKKERGHHGPPPPPVEPPEQPSPFQRILHGLGHEVDRGETMVRGALGAGGKEMSTSDLLALQAGVYRYSEAVDLAAKLVDRASSGVKTVIQGQ